MRISVSAEGNLVKAKKFLFVHIVGCTIVYGSTEPVQQRRPRRRLTQGTNGKSPGLPNGDLAPRGRGGRDREELHRLRYVRRLGRSRRVAAQR